MMQKQQSVITFDPISQSRKQSWIQVLMLTRWEHGEKVAKPDAFGHYMFCGKQRSGKTASVMWYTEKLVKKYRKKRIHNWHDLDRKNRPRRFKEPPKIKIFSNFGFGNDFNMKTLLDKIDNLDPYANEVRIFLIDEIHTYFPRDGATKEQNELIGQLEHVFSQLGKRNCYVLSTAQVYGRLNKRMREQCLYMVNNKTNINKKIVSDFIEESDIICDELGRWSGPIRSRTIHGLPRHKYDTKKLIRE